VLNKDKTSFKTTNDEPTPISCVEDMLSIIPDEVWERNNLRILDPCCGNGNFHLVIYSLLLCLGMEPEHILQDVLFFNDTNKDRILNVNHVFSGDVYNLNLSQDNFLECSFVDKFDIIVANPPYAKFLEDGKRASKNHNLIQAFLEKSLSLLKPNGYLVFITPDNWMSYADRNTVVAKITSLQLIHLNIHGAKKYFPKIGSSFTWYVVQNCPFYKDVVVEGLYKKETYITSIPSVSRRYIPLLYNNFVFYILQKTIDNVSIPKFKVETSSDLHKYTKRNLISERKDDIHKYRLIHTPNQTVYSSRPHKYQDGYKVFISTTDKYSVFVDDCGMTQSIAFIRCQDLEEATKFQQILMHPLYVFINNICRWGNFNNVRILQRFPVPVDDNNIYKCFDVSQEEQDMIEKYQ
jgi:SAM-dependent methyltransferase